MSTGESMDRRCSGTRGLNLLFAKKLWRVWKLRIITKTTPKPLDLTSNGVKTRITIESTVLEHLILSRARKHKVLSQLGCYGATSLEVV